MIASLRQMIGLDPEQRRIVGEEARQALQNRHWNEAFESVEGYLIEKAKACDPNKPEHAQNIVISLQLLEAIKREIVRKIEDGEMASVEIRELEQRKRPLRFVR
jgi:hypothetical protein